MNLLWRATDLRSVRDVLLELTPERPLAYTTVLTVLDNLHRKGWVSRQRNGRAYLYRPTATREEAAARVLRDLLSSTGGPAGVLLHFARSASDGESAVLRRGLQERAQG